MSTSFAAASTATSAISTTTSTLVGKGEVDVKLLLASRALEVDNSLVLLFLVLLLVLLLVDRGLLPLGVNVRAFTSFPQVELGTLLLGLQLLPFIQGHLLLLLFPCSLSLELFSSELSWRLWFSFFGGNFFFSLRVDSCVGLLTLLGHIILKGSPVTLATTSSLVFSLDSSSVVSGLPVVVPLAMGVDVEAIVVMGRLVSIRMRHRYMNISRASVIAGISFPLVETMSDIDIVSRKRPGDILMAITRSISNVTGISLSLVQIVSSKSLGASVGVAGTPIRMVGPGRSISKAASISLPLVQIMSSKSLGASVGIAGSAIRMVGPGRSISKEASISLPLVQIVSSKSLGAPGGVTGSTIRMPS